jgi:hypothetical protein
MLWRLLAMLPGQPFGSHVYDTDNAKAIVRDGPAARNWYGYLPPNGGDNRIQAKRGGIVFHRNVEDSSRHVICSR